MVEHVQRDEWKIILQAQFHELTWRQISKLFVALMFFFLKYINNSLAIVVDSLDNVSDLIFASSLTLSLTIKVDPEALVPVRIPKNTLLM
jgi:hypothetical protein